MSSIQTSQNIILSMCNLKIKQQSVIPTFRLELQKSPYPTYSKFELDMRRKAEILKYKSNQQNSKGNNLTKTQILSRNMINSPTISQATIDMININNCKSLSSILTPSSSCDVPGKIILLTNNNNIPLYNYSTMQNAFAVDRFASM